MVFSLIIHHLVKYIFFKFWSPLHFWNKAHFVMMYYSIYILLYSISWYFKDFFVYLGPWGNIYLFSFFFFITTLSSGGIKVYRPYKMSSKLSILLVISGRVYKRLIVLPSPMVERHTSNIIQAWSLLYGKIFNYGFNFFNKYHSIQISYLFSFDKFSFEFAYI